MPKKGAGNARLAWVTLMAMGVAFAAGLVAQALIRLIGLFTNLSFYGRWSFQFSSPAANSLGAWVVGVPVAGGVIVGLMARSGSTGIRGHGIPEAMEQVLTNESRIAPRPTFLKPLSAAIALGTGGPFGAEGPIIATGGALGSGTSGGTLAPLFTIGGGLGAVAGTAVAAWFPGLGVDPRVAALVGMSPLFAGASRAETSLKLW